MLVEKRLQPRCVQTVLVREDLQPSLFVLRAAVDTDGQGARNLPEEQQREVSPPMSRCPVAAVQPIKGGNAPGSAPTRVDNEDRRFIGVYTTTYESNAIAASSPASGVVSRVSIGTETNDSPMPNHNAVSGAMRPAGSGRLGPPHEAVRVPLEVAVQRVGTADNHRGSKHGRKARHRVDRYGREAESTTGCEQHEETQPWLCERHEAREPSGENWRALRRRVAATAPIHRRACDEVGDCRPKERPETWACRGECRRARRVNTDGARDRGIALLEGTCQADPGASSDPCCATCPTTRRFDNVTVGQMWCLHRSFTADWRGCSPLVT